MKTKFILTILLTGILFSAQAQLEQLYTANFFLNDMCCLNADTVLVCGNGGKVLKTFNGGLTWQKDSLPTKYNLQSIVVRKSGIGYLSGDSGTLFKTNNFGTNWNKVSTKGLGNLYNLEFYNDSCGYANSGDSLFYTYSSGETWNFIRQINHINNITCFGKDTIYVATFYGLFYSYNAGMKWDSYLVGQIMGQSWLNDSIGFVSNGYDIKKTVDAGKTFTGMGYSGASIIYAVNDTIIYGSNYTSLGSLNILKTTNGGRTWEVNPGFAPRRIVFLNKDAGYMLDFKSIYKTTNGCIYSYGNCSTWNGINNILLQNDVVVSPNPLINTSVIQITPPLLSASYRLYNNLGQLVEEKTITSTSNQIYKGNKPSGIYILSITDSKGNLIANQKLEIK